MTVKLLELNRVRCMEGIYSAAYAVVEKLPADELKFLIGFILCFFGGVLPGCIMSISMWMLVMKRP